MKARSILFESMHFKGITMPPATMKDISRYGNDGVFTNAPTWTKLPSNLWYLDFVSGSSQLVTIGNIGLARTIEFWINLDTTSESILEELAATGISVGTGTMAYGSWDDCYINGVNTNTITAATWNHVAITSTTDVTMSAFRLGLVNVTYLDGGISLVTVYRNELSASTITTNFQKQRFLFGV